MKINEKVKTYILFGLLAVILVLALLMGIMPMSSDSQEISVPDIKQEVPSAEEYDRPKSKKDAYGSNTGAYFDSLDEDNTYTIEIGDRKSGEGRPEAPEEISMEAVFGPEEEEVKKPQSTSRRSSGLSRATTTPSAPAKQKSDKENHGSSFSQSEQAKDEDIKPQEPVKVKRSGAVSSLDEDVTTDLGNGFSTLDGRDIWVEDEGDKAYQCMFTRSEKVRSGQRITIRTLEDLVINGVHIPQNTHLQGVCTISDRMEVSITSLDMGGRILALDFEAYDTDGQKGIYCSDLNTDAKQVADEGLNIISSRLGSRLGSTGREIASMGASIVRNKSGEVSVNIPSGYRFYIMERNNEK